VWMNSNERKELQQYLKRWEEAGERLQEDRAQRLREMTDVQARAEIAVLGGLWRPGFRDVGGDGIIQVQRVFRLQRERATGS